MRPQNDEHHHEGTRRAQSEAEAEGLAKPFRPVFGARGLASDAQTAYMSARSKWAGTAIILFVAACTESALQLTTDIDDGVDAATGTGGDAVIFTPLPLSFDAGRDDPVDAPREIPVVVAQPCSANSWDHDANPATACIAKRNCPVGTYVTSPASTTADRTCTACPPDSCAPAINSLTCLSTSLCPPGSYVSTPQSASICRSCSPCGNGFVSSGANSASCIACSPCARANEARTACIPIVGCVDCGAGARPNPSQTGCVDIDECVENIAVCANGPDGPEVEIGGPQNAYCGAVIFGSCCFNLDKIAGEKPPAPLMSTPTNSGLGFTLWDPLGFNGFYCET